MKYQIRQLEFAYSDEPVLSGISLDIGEAEFVVIVGSNGAGKSTLLKLMAGLLDPGNGTVHLEGQPVAEYAVRDLAAKVAVVPQETHIAFPFTVEEVVRMGRLPYRTSFLFDPASDDPFIDRALELTETEPLRNKTFTRISGGEKQRVVLASALAQTPDVLLLDEPTVYLDIKHQLHFYEILQRLNRDDGMTIVAVTHDINLAARYAGRMVAMAGGRIVADGEPDRILTPELLYEVFGIQADIVERPQGGRVVIPTA